MKLNGRVAVITGASTGIGAACARELSRRGAKVVLAARSAENLAVVADETGGIAIAGDITDAAVQRQVLDTAVARFGRVDILINNAGVGVYSPSHSGSMADIRQMFELNLFAALALVQLAAPGMKQQRDGMIVNISSIAGLAPLPWFTMYSATKYAVCAMTDGQRMELARYNVRTMAVCPGYVRTGFSTNVLAGKPPEKLWRNRRFAITAEECARATADGIEREKRTVVTPKAGWALVWARLVAPRIVDHYLRNIYEGLDEAGG
ncbi:MAG: SDR family NAD(P)-dependent oxidoreductase [Bryobacterales bacterium]|nr:SDR family NAD(P)-dependent oxidoreductase [Bryobacterales bacterium]